jgi:hypothetical protein
VGRIRDGFGAAARGRTGGILAVSLVIPVCMAVTVAAALALSSPVQAQAETREAGRVGKRFWARPGLSETSVEFFADAGLRRREPVYHKARFEVAEVAAGGPWPHRDTVYGVRFEDGRVAWMDARDFELRLYRELGPNEVSVSPLFEPPLGRGIQVHQFERASIFSADPDMIWERVRNQGPRRLSRGPLSLDPSATAVVPEDTAAPLIRPR